MPTGIRSASRLSDHRDSTGVWAKRKKNRRLSSHRHKSRWVRIMAWRCGVLRRLYIPINVNRSRQIYGVIGVVGTNTHYFSHLQIIKPGVLNFVQAWWRSEISWFYISSQWAGPDLRLGNSYGVFFWCIRALERLNDNLVSYPIPFIVETISSTGDVNGCGSLRSLISLQKIANWSSST